MEKTEAVSRAAEQLANCDNFILITIGKDNVDNTMFINNAGSALAMISTMRKMEYAILNPSQPSRIIKP